MYEWDAGNIDHIAEHGLSPAEVEEAAQDEHALSGEPGEIGGETRVTLIGRTSAGKILTVVVTYRAGNVRVVTAYPSNPGQRRLYLSR